MRSLIPIVFLLVSLSSQWVEAEEEAREETVRYCDKVFDLVDRTDESWARCRWSDSLSPGSLTDCEAVFSTLIGREDHDVATPALLCHKEPARASKAPY